MRVMPWLVVFLKSAAVLPGKNERKKEQTEFISGASASATQTNNKKQLLTIESASNAGHGTLVVDRTAAVTDRELKCSSGSIGPKRRVLHGQLPRIVYRTPASCFAVLKRRSFDGRRSSQVHGATQPIVGRLVSVLVL